MDVHGSHGGRRRILAPESDGQSFGAYRLIRLQEQHRQHRPRLRTAESDRAARVERFKRSENPKLHRQWRPYLLRWCETAEGERRRRGGVQRKIGASIGSLDSIRSVRCRRAATALQQLSRTVCTMTSSLIHLLYVGARQADRGRPFRRRTTR